MGALFAIILMMLLVFGVPASPLQAVSAWSDPFDLGDNQFGWFPDVVADSAGAVHVIWGSGDRNVTADPNSPTASRDLLRYRVLRDGHWSPMNEIAFTCVGGYTVRNSIVAGADGQLNVLYRSCFDVTSFHASALNAESAGAWSAPQRLGGAYYNELAIDGDGVLHAVYNEALIGDPESASLKSDIFYRRSIDGGQTWSVRTNLARMAGGDERMQLEVDVHNRVHLVWDHGSDWYLGIDEPEYGVYRRSDNGGNTWIEPTLLGVGDGPTVQTTLALSAEGNPIVVYRSARGTEIYYQISSDGGDTWSNAQLISGVRARDPLERGLDRYTMATDSSGMVHLLMVGYPDGSVAAIPMLLHLTWDGSVWSAPEIVAATPNRPIWPEAVVSGGNVLHTVWFSYTDASGWGDRRVWHSSRVLAAPALAPVPPQPFPSREGPVAGVLESSTPASFAPVPSDGASIPVLQPTARIQADFSNTPPPGALTNAPPYLAPLLALVPVLGLILIVALVARWWQSRQL